MSRIEESKKTRNIRNCTLAARMNLKVVEEELQQYLLAIFAGIAEAPDGYEVVRYGKYPALKNDLGIAIADGAHGRVFLTVATSILDIEHLCYCAEEFYKNK